jgi:hypothetical protein
LPQPCRLCKGVVVQIDNSTAECTNCGERQPIIIAETVA